MKVQGTQQTVPSIEFNVDTVYVRTSIKRIETEEFTGWEYDEEQYSLKEYLSEMANKSLILSEENTLLKAQNEALNGQTQFLEECIVEMATMIYEP